MDEICNHNKIDLIGCEIQDVDMARKFKIWNFILYFS